MSIIHCVLSDFPGETEQVFSSVLVDFPGVIRTGILHSVLADFPGEIRNGYSSLYSG